MKYVRFSLFLAALSAIRHEAHEIAALRFPYLIQKQPIHAQVQLFPGGFFPIPIKPRLKGLGAMMTQGRSSKSATKPPKRLKKSDTIRSGSNSETTFAKISSIS